MQQSLLRAKAASAAERGTISFQSEAFIRVIRVIRGSNSTVLERPFSFWPNELKSARLRLAPRFSFVSPIRARFARGFHRLSATSQV
jgi:hypothetical protein